MNKAQKHDNSPYWYALVSGYNEEKRNDIENAVNGVLERQVNYKMEEGSLKAYVTRNETDKIGQSMVLAKILYGKEGD